MRILQLHVDWIKWKPVEKEIKNAELAEKKEQKIENALVAFVSIEKNDNEETCRKAIKEISKTAEILKVKRLVIYPYAHLSSQLSEPETAKKLLSLLTMFAAESGFEVYKAPFGWNKALALSVKAHPLAESGISVTASEFKERKLEYEFEKISDRTATAAYLIAYAVSRVFPKASLVDFGEKGEKGYYDVKIDRPISSEEVEAIEKELESFKGKVEMEELDKKSAKEKLNEYKKIVVDSIDSEKVKLVKIDGLYDVCKCDNLVDKKLFIKILGTSASYWKFSKESTQRIWFVAFESKEELENYLKSLEEAKARDHRYLGEKLDLFHIEEEIIGSGLPILHPKGMIIRNELIKLIRSVNRKLGFEEVWTPHLSKTTLWKISGHYEKYRDKMFLWEMDGEEWGLKPMNCPIHIQVYKFKKRSYKDLPIRYAEFATVYRKEQSGELHGLARVWSLTQDDHHLFVRPDQIKEEIQKLVKAVIDVYTLFGLEYKVNLSTKPEKYIGDDRIWEISENSLKEILDEMKESYGIEYEIKDGEGAFYGPKIDFDVKDALGRWWQLGTIQLDFFMPQRFELSYTDSSGEEKRPVMIHFALLGSIERFMAMIIEHFKGRLPLWLSPVQVRVLPLSEKYTKEAEELKNELENAGIRVDLVEKGTLNYRIREAEKEKVPVIAIIGEKEISTNTIAVRYKSRTSVIKREEFIQILKEKIEKREL